MSLRKNRPYSEYVDNTSWRTPTWLKWVQILWNLTVGVGIVLILVLAHWNLVRPWMVVVCVAAGLPCAVLNHILAEHEGRELTPE